VFLVIVGSICFLASFYAIASPWISARIAAGALCAERRSKAKSSVSISISALGHRTGSAQIASQNPRSRDPL
jgi:hypothetical protein